MLAPLTALVVECGQTKITKAKGTKKVPWHWDEVHQRAFDQVKATIARDARDVVLAYPEYSEVFEIYTINKLLNKLSQILLCSIWTDKGLFDCRV